MTRTSRLLLAALLTVSACSSGPATSTRAQRTPQRGAAGAGRTTIPPIAYSTGARVVVTGTGRGDLSYPVGKSEDDDAAGGTFSWSADGRYVSWWSGGRFGVVNVADTSTGRKNSWPCPCTGGAFVGNTLIVLSLDSTILTLEPGAASLTRTALKGPVAKARRSSSRVIGADSQGVVAMYEKGSKEYSFYTISPDGGSRRFGGPVPRQWPGTAAWDFEHRVTAFGTASNGGPCGMSDRIVLLFPPSRETRLLTLPASARRWNVSHVAWGADGKLYASLNRWFPCNENGDGIDYAHTDIWRLDGGQWTDTGRHLAHYQPVSPQTYVGLRFHAPADGDTQPDTDLVVGSLGSGAEQPVARNVVDFAVSPRAVRRTGTAPTRATALPTKPVPVLGRSADQYQEGYGTVLPTKIFNGGDPSGLVQNVRWSNWGSPQATATGQALWVTTSVADGVMEPVQVVATDLGDCMGTMAYRKLTWYFPQHGQKFTPGDLADICDR